MQKGGGNKRPSFDEMMKDVELRNINVIVAFKLDRLTRSVYDVEDFISKVNKYGCDVDCELKNYGKFDWMYDIYDDIVKKLKKENKDSMKFTIVYTNGII